MFVVFIGHGYDKNKKVSMHTASRIDTRRRIHTRLAVARVSRVRVS